MLINPCNLSGILTEDEEAYMTAEKIFSQFRELSTTKRGMGDTFERFFKKYLLTDPLYADVLQDVWMWFRFFYNGTFTWLFI